MPRLDKRYLCNNACHWSDLGCIVNALKLWLSHLFFFPVSCPRRALTLLRMEKEGLLSEPSLTAAEALARLDELSVFYSMDSTWETFKQWVKRTQTQDKWLQVRSLKLRTKPEHAAITPAVINKTFDSLESLLQEVGIMGKDKAILEAEACRLCCTDEKGISQRSDSLQKACAPKASKPTGTKPDVTWDHITILSFLPLRGDRYPLGIVTPTKRTHPDFSKALPDAKFVGNPSGSVTVSSFAYFLSECYGKHARQVLGIPMDKALVLILDTGGGCLLHLNAAVVASALRWNIRLFFLPAYGTRAMMPLDQQCHQQMS